MSEKCKGQPKALAIMARSPVLHQCKTRLIPALGARRALQAHIELVEDTLVRLSVLEDVQLSLWVTQADEASQAWAQEFGLPLFVQQGDDLGAKMHNTLACLLGSGAQKACLVGTDCPQINSSYVTEAFDALPEKPVVLGPAEDGGYGLIGLTQACAALFQGIEWSSSNVCTQTMKNAAAAGLEVALLDTIWDVDEPADWRRYLRWKARNS